MTVTSGTPAEDLRVGFVGLGVMGSAMARRLLGLGYDVAVYNRSPAKAEALAHFGARICPTPGDVAARSDVILGCLLDTDAVKSVYLGRDGLLQATRVGTVLMEHATFDPAVAQEIALRARGIGAEFLDAPVTGGPEGAAAGTLTAMVGGTQSALESVRPILNAYAGRIEYVGESGSGLALKLVNQLLVTCHLAAAAEAGAVIRELHLPAATAEQVLASGWAASAMLSRSLPRVASGDYDSVGATIGGLIEVQALVADLAARTGVALRTFPAARAVFDASVAAGYGPNDPAALVEVCAKPEHEPAALGA